MPTDNMPINYLAQINPGLMGLVNLVNRSQEIDTLQRAQDKKLEQMKQEQAANLVKYQKEQEIKSGYESTANIQQAGLKEAAAVSEFNRNLPLKQAELAIQEKLVGMKLDKIIKGGLFTGMTPEEVEKKYGLKVIGGYANEQPQYGLPKNEIPIVSVRDINTLISDVDEKELIGQATPGDLDIRDKMAELRKNMLDKVSAKYGVKQGVSQPGPIPNKETAAQFIGRYIKENPKNRATVEKYFSSRSQEDIAESLGWKK